jgi:hypothetical protein
MKVVFEVTVDPSWDSIPLSFWNIVEVNVAIVCACSLTLKPLIDKLWPRLLDPPSGDAGADMESADGSSANDGSPHGSLARRFKRSGLDS